MTAIKPECSSFAFEEHSTQTGHQTSSSRKFRAAQYSVCGNTSDSESGCGPSWQAGQKYKCHNSTESTVTSPKGMAVSQLGEFDDHKTLDTHYNNLSVKNCDKMKDTCITT